MRFLLLLLSILALTGCAANVYQPSRTSGFELDRNAEIDDDDVRKAFEAKPQLGATMKVALYSFDPKHEDDLEKTVKTVPGVEGTYRIPGLIATGQRRLAEPNPWNVTTQPLSIKQLRLIAARARCDVLVVVDYGWRVDSEVNGLVAFNVALLPALFLPFRDVKTTSYVEAYMIDVRNGYLYGQVGSERSSEEKFVTIYSSPDATLATQWKDLEGELHGALVKLANDERKLAKQ
jgi:hypothetical protein